uniref:Trehalase n=1 Tax=Haemonchus contortus TaxID=6289 RepID=A0A7I4YT85_HAECO
MLRVTSLLLIFCSSVAALSSLLNQIHWVHDPVPVCDATNSNNSYIYCNGTLLMAVNYHELFNDSKTFVDMPMRYDPDYVLRQFNNEFSNVSIENINRTKLKVFINEHFSPAGSEMMSCTPMDWHPQPAKLMTIADPQLREWALKLNAIWLTLCRKIDPDIERDNARHSIIYLPNNFIMPGGRFREFYYWDAYWIIKGLVACEMYDTTRSMIENLGSVVERYGFIPNGGRVYYLQRSHPPLLAGMLYEYYEATKDKDFMRSMLSTLERELQFWENNRKVNVTVDGETYSVFRYKTNSNMPRPESFLVDIIKAQNLPDKTRFWQNVASAAESGWDFSTRWFGDKRTIYSIETTSILPVDLNAFICWNYELLEYFFERIGNQVKSEFYREVRAKFRNTVHKVFYNHTAGTWFDYNLRTGAHNAEFYPSITVPLFTGCYNTLNQGKSERLFSLMKSLGVLEYPGGVPTSMMQDSDEQWDFPNGFSPLNHMIVEGLRKSQNAQMQDAAFQLAQKWLSGNFRVWKETHHMWEKYNVIGDAPRPGTGGEYDVQDGFGWTNGVILDLLVTYNDRLRV